MDDLKLYMKSEKALESLVYTAPIVSVDIWAEFASQNVLSLVSEEKKI